MPKPPRSRNRPRSVHDARHKLAEFRRTFHKPVTYAAWDWDATVFDALQQAGFASWEEQAEALRLQREKFATA